MRYSIKSDLKQTILYFCLLLFGFYLGFRISSEINKEDKWVHVDIYGSSMYVNFEPEFTGQWYYLGKDEVLSIRSSLLDTLRLKRR